MLRRRIIGGHHHSSCAYHPLSSSAASLLFLPHLLGGASSGVVMRIGSGTNTFSSSSSSSSSAATPLLLQRRFSSNSAQIRHLTKVLKNKSEAQTELYDTCLEAASQLQPKSFIEVGSSISDNVTSLTSMPLSGAVIAVSDAVDVEGFSTRYDVSTSMLHKVPKEDQPFVKWLRLQGARVAGKLVGASPLCFEETSDLTVHSAAVAIERKACHYAVLNSFIGAAGLTASCKYDVVTFKPACRSLEDGAVRFSSSCGSMSVMASRIDDIMYLWEVYTGTNKKIEELASKYSDEAGLATMAAEAAQQSGGSASAYVQAAHLVAEAVKAPPTLFGLLKRRFLVSATALGLNFFKPRDQHIHAFTSTWQQRREGVLKVGIPIALIDEYYGDKMSAHDFELKLRTMYETLRIARNASSGVGGVGVGGANGKNGIIDEKSILNSEGKDVTTAEATEPSSSSSDDGALTSGAGGSSDLSSSNAKGSKKGKRRRNLLSLWWRLWAGADYDPTAALARDAANSSQNRRDYRIDFIPVHLNMDLDKYVHNIQTIANYELAEQFMRENAAKLQQQQAAGGGSDSSLASAASVVDSSSPAAVFGTGLFEELPQSLVSTLFNAKSISPSEYNQTLQLTAERTSSTIDEVFVDVDILCLPIVSEPFVHLNIRTSNFSLPFVNNGNPLISLQLSKDVSVMLVGELGRSTQLLEDAVSFADHVKGDAPSKWWRRALFGSGQR